MPATIGGDDLARDHLEVAPLGPVPMAHVAAIQPDHDRTAGRLCCWRLRGLGDVRPHDLRADPQRPAAHRAGVLRPAERQQLGQQRRHLAERCEGGVPGCDIGQLRGQRVLAELENGAALRPGRTLAGAGEPPADPDRHVTEQGAERRPVMAFADQHLPAGLARATALTESGDLRRHELGLQRRREPLRLVQPQPELGHSGLRVTLNLGELGLRDHARREFRDQLHPPHQLRHQPTLIP